MKAAAAATSPVGAQPRAVLPTSNTHTDVESTSTDMTSDDDDDDSSIQSSDSTGGGGTGGNDAAGNVPAVTQMPNGGSFDGAFAAFNIGHQ